MSVNVGSQLRVKVDGKFFRLGGHKFFPKGVCYGPFAPDKFGFHFPNEEQVRRDFELIKELGANVLRIYHKPPLWFLNLANDYGLKLFIDIPWSTHICFLDSEFEKEQARNAVREVVKQCAGHPGVFAYSVANEIKPDIVRWSGVKEVSEFLDSLIEEAKNIDPECLCTYGNFPPTEYLQVENADFCCFNVYLYKKKPFENYLARLQMLADSKPLVLGEFGVDSIREGEEKKSEILKWQIESAFRSGLAGTILFSFTDEWFTGGHYITDWAMGLTTADRQKKPSFYAVQEEYRKAPYYPLSRYPEVSVVVACYNGARTLKTCLESLSRLNYPDYEVIVVDDGSTDATQEIARLFKNIKYIRNSENKGLSCARNIGIQMAKGEIVAFTDADCRADEDWLYYLVGDLIQNEFVGIGGPNYLPPDDSPVAAAVMSSPGGPAHVMLTDKIAEHIPGCNMAFYKWVLAEAGYFDPVFKIAGDDVDICWRIQQLGYKIGFSPSAFVWHYRRSSVRDYLKQQYGYGEAEGLLARKHPEYFNTLGGSIWNGRIYSSSSAGVTARRPIIYHGQFGTGMFQTLYSPPPVSAFMLCTSLEYHTLITVPLLVLSAPFPFLLPIALFNLLFVIGICAVAGWQAKIPKTKLRVWSRPLVALMYFLQPIVRGYARYHKRLLASPKKLKESERFESLSAKYSEELPEIVSYWSNQPVSRIKFLSAVQAHLEQNGWEYRVDSGWSNYDIEVLGSRWSTVQLITAEEFYANDKRKFKCRVQSNWSLFGKVAFWGALGLELLIIGLLGRYSAWMWMLLLTMPLLLWYFANEERTLRSIMLVFLDDVAKSLNLIKLKQEDKDKPPQNKVEV